MGRRQTAARPLAADRAAWVVDLLSILPAIAHKERLLATPVVGVDRDDVLAAGALALCRAAATFDPDAREDANNFTAYAWTAATNAMRQVAWGGWRARHQSRPDRRLTSLDALPAGTADAAAGLGGDGLSVSAERVVLRLLAREQVRAAIRTMPDELRQVVVEHWYHELPVAEIAERHGLSDHQLRRRLYAAYRWLAVTAVETDPALPWVIAAAARAATGRPAPAPADLVIHVAGRRQVRAALAALGDRSPWLYELVCDRWYDRLAVDQVARRRGRSVAQVTQHLAGAYGLLADAVDETDPAAARVLAAASEYAHSAHDAHDGGAELGMAS